MPTSTSHPEVGPGAPVHAPRRGAGRRGPRRGALGTVAAVGLVAVVTAGCSSGSSAPTTTTGGPTTTAAGAATTATRTLQGALASVGCYSGAIDGIAGPQTTRAVRAFQAASGLAADGVYGPNTEGLLLAAVRAGKKACGTTAPTTTTAVPSSTTTSTTSASGTAPCTAAAIGAALPAGEKVISFQCAQGWAAGSTSNPSYESAYLLQSSKGVWVQPPADACANAASLGIPTAILAVSPCKVS